MSVVAAQGLGRTSSFWYVLNDAQEMVQDKEVQLDVNSYTRRMILARLDREGKRRGQRLHFF